LIRAADGLVNDITAMGEQASDFLNQVGEKQTQLEAAQRDLVIKKSIELLNQELNRRQEDLIKAKGALGEAKQALQFGNALLKNLIPCADGPPGK
jgi:hypothetical protein